MAYLSPSANTANIQSRLMGCARPVKSATGQRTPFIMPTTRSRSAKGVTVGNPVRRQVRGSTLSRRLGMLYVPKSNMVECRAPINAKTVGPSAPQKPTTTIILIHCRYSFCAAHVTERAMIISELEYRLQTVPRWGIVRTIQKQSVAEHSFFVAIAAARIATEYWGWGEDHDWYSLHREALLHDQVEAITGDVPAIAKHYVESDMIITKDFEEHIEEIVGVSFEIINIVKAADLYECCRFLATELSMGNRSIETIYHKSVGALHRHMHSCGKAQHFKMLEEIKDLCNAHIDPMVAT